MFISVPALCIKVRMWLIDYLRKREKNSDKKQTPRVKTCKTRLVYSPSDKPSMHQQQARQQLRFHSALPSAADNSYEVPSLSNNSELAESLYDNVDEVTVHHEQNFNEIYDENIYIEHAINNSQQDSMNDSLIETPELSVNYTVHPKVSIIEETNEVSVNNYINDEMSLNEQDNYLPNEPQEEHEDDFFEQPFIEESRTVLSSQCVGAVDSSVCAEHDVSEMSMSMYSANTSVVSGLEYRNASGGSSIRETQQETRASQAPPRPTFVITENRYDTRELKYNYQDCEKADDDEIESTPAEKIMASLRFDTNLCDTPQNRTVYATPMAKSFVSTPSGSVYGTPSGSSFVSTPRNKFFYSPLNKDAHFMAFGVNQTSTPVATEAFVTPNNCVRSVQVLNSAGPYRLSASKSVKSRRVLGPLMDDSQGGKKPCMARSSESKQQSMPISSPSISSSVTDENAYGVYEPVSKNIPSSPQHSRVFKNSQNIPNSPKRFESDVDLDGIKPLNCDEPFSTDTYRTSLYANNRCSFQTSHTTPSFTRHSQPAKVSTEMMKDFGLPWSSFSSAPQSTVNKIESHNKPFSGPEHSTLRSTLLGEHRQPIKRVHYQVITERCAEQSDKDKFVVRGHRYRQYQHGSNSALVGVESRPLKPSCLERTNTFTPYSRPFTSIKSPSRYIYRGDKSSDFKVSAEHLYALNKSDSMNAVHNVSSVDRYHCIDRKLANAEYDPHYNPVHSFSIARVDSVKTERNVATSPNNVHNPTESDQDWHRSSSNLEDCNLIHTRVITYSSEHTRDKSPKIANVPVNSPEPLVCFSSDSKQFISSVDVSLSPVSDASEIDVVSEYPVLVPAALNTIAINNAPAETTPSLTPSKGSYPKGMIFSPHKFMPKKRWMSLMRLSDDQVPEIRPADAKVPSTLNLPIVTPHSSADKKSLCLESVTVVSKLSQDNVAVDDHVFAVPDEPLNLSRR